jgi:hypothetical protein
MTGAFEIADDDGRNSVIVVDDEHLRHGPKRNEESVARHARLALVTAP